MPDVARLRSNLYAFSRAIGAPLTRWQARSFALEPFITVVVAPRQSGKSNSTNVVALHQSFRRPGQRVMIVSASEDAARRNLADIRRIAGRSKLLAGSVVTEQAGLVVLSNGSEIRSVPASERQVRGWSNDLLIIDEAAMVADDLALGAAFPTTAARPESKIILASSPSTASGFFYDHAIRGETASGSGTVRTFRWSLGDCPWISPSQIQAARESLTPWRFACEYEGKFASGFDAFFTREIIERALVDFSPIPLGELRGPARGTIGLDWGASNDRCAAVGIYRLPEHPRPGTFGVALAQRWRAGAPLVGDRGVIAEIANSWAHVAALTAEANGLGEPCCQELWRRWEERHPTSGGGRPSSLRLMNADRFFALTDPNRDSSDPRIGAPEPPRFVTRKTAIHTSARMKAATYSALRMLVDRGALVIPRGAEDLIRELLLLRVEMTQSGSEKIEASSGHDDLADALAFALRPYRDRAGDWRTWIGDLADPASPIPSPAGRLVPADDLPRTPVLQSVAGPELTLPHGYISRARAAHATESERIARRAREIQRNRRKEAMK